MKQAAAAGLAGLVVIASSASADSGTANGVAASAGVGALSVFMCTSVALAFKDLPEEPYARQGWLLGASGVYAADTREHDLESALRNAVDEPVNFSLKDSFGFKGQAGYRCHSRFSAEVDVEWLDGFDGTVFESSSGKIATIDFEPVVVTTSLRGYVLTGRYQPYVLVG
jgi:hypothetical protein